MLLAADGGNWQVHDDAFWCHVTPRSYPTRTQGWKLHVSATRLSAPLVLHRVAQVLIPRSCAFKFAGTMRRVAELTSKNADRAQAGKFIAIYPRDDDELRELAPILDQATADLPGPAVLSDRPVRPGSLVHYRYGAFQGVSVFTNDGVYETRLEAPDGTLVEDARQPWFSPPPWAGLPFEGRPGQAARPAKPKPVLLGGRFRAEKALIHTARGGVYRAVDQQTGARVVIKQARAHILGINHVGDARDGLRHEARMLEELHGLTPAVVQLFEQGDRVFLAVEELNGEPFSVWVHNRWQDASGEGVSTAEAVRIAGQLADLVGEVHQRGLIFRDLAPGNVMMLEDGQLRLIDTEAVTQPGSWVTQVQTPGFAAPEVLTGMGVGPAPGPEVDYYALGALLCHLVTGQPPALPPDSSSHAGDDPVAKTRSAVERFTLLLEYAAVDNPAAQRLAPAILGLTQDDPQQRWDLIRLRAFLSEPTTSTGPSLPLDTGQLTADRQQRMITDGLAYLIGKLDVAAGERLVPNHDLTIRPDSCNVQYGAAGVLGVLVRASELLGQAEVTAAVSRVARWLDERRMTVPKLLPGLYFGRSGTAWALYAAARHLADDAMVERALELAAAVPVRWPNPDITHGTAGAGMASLYLWTQTKESVFLERVNAAVDHLGEVVEHTVDGGVHWRVPDDFDSQLAGTASFGFAHGVAGVGTFLLAAARATGRSDAHTFAVQAGQTLVNAAVRHGGAAYWPNDVTGPAAGDLRYQWCNGASGVGTFLVRLWQHTGAEIYRQLAHEAAVMVRRGRWLVGVSQCHGLSGNGEFLLDLAAAGNPDDPYRGWAEELAGCLYAKHARRNGRIVVSDNELNLDFGTGFAGVVGFLLRLRHGGPRWWMCDEVESP
jgi:serine/threonine protein kinase